PQDVARHEVDDGAEYGTPEADEASADEGHEHHDAGGVERHHLHVGALLRHGEEAAGQAGDGGRECQAYPFVAPHVVAEERRQQAQPEVRGEVELCEAEGVAADAEERAVPEGREARVPERQVISQRVETPDEHLDPEVAVETDLGDPERQRAEHRERRDEGERNRPGARGYFSRTLSLPSSPRPRTVITRIRSRYMENRDQSVL